MNTATFVKQIEGWAGDARLYRLSESVPFSPDFFTDNRGLSDTTYVIVSAVNAMFSGPETYIFAADQSGEALSFSELDGSFRGDLDHERALRLAGIKLAS